jgi:outer membrane protein OmpA-like peptidoglycan-associated protein
MKKYAYLLLILLAAVPGCGKKKNKGKKHGKDVAKEINIPTAEDGIKSVFNDELGEFTLAEDGTVIRKTALSDEDFSWLDDKKDGFKRVFFEFDQYKIKADQESSLASNIQRAKKVIDENPGKSVTLVVNGHGCTSAGSAVYNLALSEKRAKVLADKLKLAGIEASKIKIVGRGFEVPAHDKNGQPVTGNRETQWPNRRDEIQVIIG